MYFDANFPKWTSSKLYNKGCQYYSKEREESTTDTTLVGFDILNKRTQEAMRTMKNNNFHSPDDRFNPPGG